MAKERPGVMLYWEMFDVLESLLDGQAKTMLQAIRNYSQYGEVPDFAGDALLSTLWMLVKPKIDADSLRYEQIIEQRRRAGKTSAAKRSSESNGCQQPLTDADGCQQIQPPTTPTTPTTTFSSAKTELSTGSLTVEGEEKFDFVENSVENSPFDFEKARIEKLQALQNWMPKEELK